MYVRKIGGEFCEYEVWLTESMMIHIGKYVDDDKNFYINVNDDPGGYLDLDVDKPFANYDRGVNYIRWKAVVHANKILSYIGSYTQIYKD